MAIKKVLLSKKINNVVYDIFPKTAAEVVTYEQTTVAATLSQFATDLSNVYTKTDADAAIKKSSDDLYNKIMGITDADGTTVNEAYDTLKEVAAWIDEHENDIAAGFTTDIAALKAAVGVAPSEGVTGSGLLKAMADAEAAISSNDADIKDLQEAVDDLEAAVGDANAGLIKAMNEAQADIQALKTTVGDAKSGLVKDMTEAQADIQALETTVGDANSGLVKAVADLQSVGATKVEASTTNGNIKVDDQEVVVYTHPTTHAATEIVEDDDHKFVTKAEKEIIANAAAIVLVSSQNDVVNENNLYLVELA